MFKDERAATKALNRNGAQVAGGFRTRVDLAAETSSRDKRPVFVGNLPLRTVVGDRFGLWEHHGSRITRGRLTAVGRGLGSSRSEMK